MSDTQTVGRQLFTLAACLGFVLVQLDVSIVNVGLHALKQAYNAGVTDLEWVINAYSLVFAALLLTTGSLVDRFGSKAVFISGVMIFIVASVSCALAPSIYWLDMMRGIQGFGAALLVPSSLTLLRQYHRDELQRNGAIAMWAAAGSLALVAGPVTGGVLIKYFGWKSIFLINFPLGLISVFIIYRLAPGHTAQPVKMNYVSQLSMAAGLGLLTFALTESGRYGWGSWPTLTVLIAALLAFGIWRLSEQRAQNPVIAAEVLGNRLIVSAVGVGFLCNLVFYGAVFIFSIFFQNQLHLSAMETGIAFMPMMAFTALLNYSSKWFTRRFRVRTLSLFGSALSLLGFAALLRIAPTWGTLQLLVPMMLLGGGTSFAMPVMTNLVLSQASHQAAGSASAFFNCARQMGGVSGVAIFGLILNASGESGMTHGLKMVALSAGILTLLWFFVSVRRLPARTLQALS